MLKSFVFILFLSAAVFCPLMAESQTPDDSSPRGSSLVAPPPQEHIPNVIEEEGTPVPFFISYFFALVDVDNTGKVLVTEQFKTVNHTDETIKIIRTLPLRSEILEAGDGELQGFHKNRISFQVPPGSKLFSITYRDDSVFFSDSSEDMVFYRFTNQFKAPIAYTGGALLMHPNTKVTAYRSQKEPVNGDPSPAFSKTDQEKNVGFFINDPLAPFDSFMMASTIEKGQIQVPKNRLHQKMIPIGLSAVFALFLAFYIRKIPSRLRRETKPFQICPFIKASSPHFTISSLGLATLLSDYIDKGYIDLQPTSFVLKSEGQTQEEQEFLKALFSGQTELPFDTALPSIKRLRTVLEHYIIRKLKSLFIKFYLKFYIFAFILTVIMSGVLFYFNPAYVFFGVIALPILSGLMVLDYFKEMSGGEGVIADLVEQYGDAPLPDEEKVSHLEVLLEKIDSRLSKKRTFPDQ